MFREKDSMNRDYYIAQVHFVVHSDIPLEAYEAEEKFTVPVLPVVHDIPVDISLVSEIQIPEGDDTKEESCRIWQEGEMEIRLYDFFDVCLNAFRSEWDGEKIRILIKETAWKIHMSTFRPWSYMHLERVLLKYDALILHSASIIYDQKAILFTAPSETGKTTQTDIWHRNEPMVQDLNGDRTILLRTSEGWYACGIPISGTSTRCEQLIAPIAGIVVVSRAEKDSISELSTMEKVVFLYDQITICSIQAKDAEKALDLIEDLVQSERMLQLNCTMEDSAYQVLKAALFD